MNKCKGFTLVELMVSIIILAVLTAIVVPNFNEFVIKIRVDNEISQLHRLLLIARNSAINANQDVTLCPLDANYHCSTDWQNQIVVFIDINDDKIFSPESNEVIIRMKPAIKIADKLQYGLTRNRIKFAPTGRTTGWGSNGTLKYCPQDFDNFSRAIVVATSGRFYPSTDLDHDGKDEKRNGSEIVCR
ncbi:MAG: GspH/FimT family pseudopilin [Colwellia sp.]|nr:GspH/FimT family pseudopilin [Colwellia sp.]